MPSKKEDNSLNQRPGAPEAPAAPPAEKSPVVVSHSERFTNKVLSEFGSNVAGGLKVTEFQRQLIQGYFIGIDRALKTAEEERLRKNKNNKDHSYDNPIPVTWERVNLTDLALDVVHYAKMGLDMMQDNHLFPIPFKNNKTEKYDVNLMPGYNGIKYIAEKYAVDKPLAVTVELVYDTDVFVPIKKSNGVEVESYDFHIVNPFDRGAIIGGFGYIQYTDPTKNKLIIMSMRDIEKRKPDYASANFWGGTASEWVNGKKESVQKEGWLDEMCRKTIIREVYSAKHMPRDPQKVDEAYQHMKLMEARYAEQAAQSEIDANANGEVIDTSFRVEDDEPPAAPVPLPEPERTEPTPPAPEPVPGTTPPTGGPAPTGGPNF